MRGVVERSPAIARLRERCAAVPEAAAYYDRIQLGQLVAAEVERRASATRAWCSSGSSRSRSPRGWSRPRRPTPPSTPPSWSSETRVDEFSEAVAALGREFAGRIRLRYVGPLPPYSFSGEERPRGARHGPDHRPAHAPARARARHRLDRRAHPGAGRGASSTTRARSARS